MKKLFDCIVCPMSCPLEVEIEDGQVLEVQGYSCMRGKVFAQSEVIQPMRMVTTTICIHQAIHPLLPVITSQNVEKSKIFDIIKICKTLEVNAPIKMGDILVKNIANTGVDLCASRTMEKRKCVVQSKNNTSDNRS